MNRGLCIAGGVLLFVCGCAEFGRHSFHNAAAVSRVTIMGADGPITKEQKEGSWFSIGALIGAAVPWYSTDRYKVVNNVVVREHSAKPIDYFNPSVFALPSATVWNRRGESGKPALSLSLILPITGSAKDNLSTGLGLSFGFAIRGGFELGFALAAVVVQTPRLSDAQQRSYDTQMALPEGESSTISNSAAATGVIGLYVTPIAK